MSQFLKADNKVVSIDAITHADFSNIEQLQVRLFIGKSHFFTATGIDAIEAAMALKPSVLESRRLRWQRHAWTVHNLVGHPVMQLLAFLRQHKAAMWVHDATVPKPRGKR